MASVMAALLRNEMRAFFRNKVGVFWALLFPLFLFAVLFLAYGGSGLGSARVVFVDAAPSDASRELVSEVSALAQQQDVVSLRFTHALAPDAVRVTLPPSLDHVPPGVAPLPITITQPRGGDAAGAAAARVLAVAISEYAIARSGAKLLVTPLLLAAADADSRLSYGQFLLGGVLVMMMLSTGIISTATVLAIMREHDVLRIYGCLPIPRVQFVAALLLVRLLLILVFSLLLLVVARYVFGLDVALWSLRILPVLGLVLTGGMACLALGLLLGARAQSMASATVIANAVYFLLFFLGNLTLDLRALPEHMRHLLHFLPVAALADALRAALFQASDPVASLRVMALLLLGGTATTLMAARCFRWSR